MCFDTHLVVAKFEINQITNEKDMSSKQPQNIRSVTLLFDILSPCECSKENIS